MSTSAIKAGEAFVALGIRDQLTKGLVAAKKKLFAWASGLRSAGLAATGLGASLLAPLLAAAHEFAGMGDELVKASDRTGVAIESLSALKYAAAQSDVAFTDLQSGLRNMQRTLAAATSGNKSAIETLGRLGLTAQVLSRLSPDQQFIALAEAVSQIDDPATRAALAMKLFGKAGVTLLPLLITGAKGIQELQERAAKLGLIVSAEDAQNATKLGDIFADLLTQMRQFVFIVGAVLAPHLITIIDLMTQWGTAAIEFINNNRVLVQVVAATALTLFAMGAGLLAVAAASTVLGFVLSGLSGIIAFASGAWAMLLSIKAAWAAADAFILGLLSLNVLALTAEGFAALWAAIQTALLTAATAALEAVLGVLLSPLVLVTAALLVLAGALIYGVYAFFAFTQMGQTSLKILGDLFGNLWATAKQTVGGIFDAIVAGRWDLAAKVAGAGLALAWEHVVFALKRLWIEFKVWLSNMFFDLVVGLADTLDELLNRVIKAFNAIRAEVGLAPIEFRFKLVEGPLAQAKGMRKLNETVRKGEIAQAQTSVDKAQADLDKATAEASTARTDAAERRKANMQNILRTAMKGPESGEGGPTGIGTLGTFSAAVAGLLGRSSPDSFAERTANATESMDEKMDDMLDALEEGGLFAT